VAGLWPEVRETVVQVVGKGHLARGYDLIDVVQEVFIKPHIELCQ
jgi:hypothetical protein